MGLVAALVLGLVAGALVTSRGFGFLPFFSTFRYGGLLLWCICIVLCPLAVCMVTNRWRVTLALMANAVLTASVEYQSYLFIKRFHQDAWAYMRKDFELDMSMAVVALLVGACVGYAAWRRQRAEPTGLGQ
jgi:hypothetical protein